MAEFGRGDDDDLALGVGLGLLLLLSDICIDGSPLVELLYLFFKSFHFSLIKIIPVTDRKFMLQLINLFPTNNQTGIEPFNLYPLLMNLFTGESCLLL